MTELVRAGYYDSTLLHPLGALAIVVLGLLTMVLPRRLAILPRSGARSFVPETVPPAASPPYVSSQPL